MKYGFVTRCAITILSAALFVPPFAVLHAQDGIYTTQDVYEPERRFQLQFYGGYEAFRNDAAHYAIETGGDLDYSTVGTRVVIDQKAREFTPTIGLRLGMQEIRDRSNFRHNVYLNILANGFVGPTYMMKAGIDYEPEFRRSMSPLGAFIGFGVGISHIWQQIGEVGSAPGDLFFETEPGDYFAEGSTISMRSDVLPYFTVSLGVRLYFGRYSNIFALAGYQFSRAADIWHYRIVDPAEEDMLYEFPDSPFPRSPSAIDQDGSYFRIGISIAQDSD